MCVLWIERTIFVLSKKEPRTIRYTETFRLNLKCIQQLLSLSIFSYLHMRKKLFEPKTALISHSLMSCLLPFFPTSTFCVQCSLLPTIVSHFKNFSCIFSSSVCALTHTQRTARAANDDDVGVSSCGRISPPLTCTIPPNGSVGRRWSWAAHTHTHTVLTS